MGIFGLILEKLTIYLLLLFLELAYVVLVLLILFI